MFLKYNPELSKCELYLKYFDSSNYRALKTQTVPL
jgi:hypothetical protein